MSWDYNCEFATGVAAATLAVHSLTKAEEEYKRKMREDFEKSKTELQTRKDNSVRVTRYSSSKETKDADQRVRERAMPSRKTVVLTDQRQKGSSTRNEVKESKVDSWEKAQRRKINKRYEKLKSEVLVWENAKKREAKIRMERKKNELELRKSRNYQHYLIKLDRIDAIAGGAKGQLEETKRNDECEVKEKAKYMRSKGKNPVKCFCC
ncbi:hypothetical protein JCGZ_11684 [Jatropha curcas]|uniref:Remorin C-terminal domain-containing protein n=1 Tax=Jatropha curcas TaxID=180498 RepID=A0A067K8I1_JATCU|nr:hypothetical protein JCGZ_11684 [Jatropha curcas]